MVEKMNDKNVKVNGGISFTGLLQIVFITLKLCKVINWSWWWVLSPIWISAGLTIFLFLLILFIGFLMNR